MRRVRVKGAGWFDAPRYVVRVTDGWQVRPPDLPSKYFCDGWPRDAEKSLRAATRYLKKQGFHPNSPVRLHKEERDSKQIKLGEPGIFLRFKTKKGRTAREVELLISRKEGPSRVLYVGTEHNYENRLAEKLEQAIGVRRAFEKERLRQHIRGKL